MERCILCIYNNFNENILNRSGRSFGKCSSRDFICWGIGYFSKKFLMKRLIGFMCVDNLHGITWTSSGNKILSYPADR